jgi:alkylhydroperoxidase family enzyme
MEQRLSYSEVFQGAVKAMYGLEGYLAKRGLQASVVNIIKLRASQINGCTHRLVKRLKDLSSV